MFTIGHVARATSARVQTFRRARKLGFPLDEIRELLSLAGDPNRPCDAAVAITRRIARLNALKCELERMIEHCRGDGISDCRVIEVLGNHAQCLADDHRTTEANP